MRFLDRIVQAVLAGCVAALGGYIILGAVGIAAENGAFQNTPLLSAVYEKIEEWTTGTYLPVLSYVNEAPAKETLSGGNVQEMAERAAKEVTGKLLNEQYPLPAYLQQQKNRRLPVESSSEYELIVRAEAQAEEHMQPRDMREVTGLPPETAQEPERSDASGLREEVGDMSFEQLLNRYFSMDVTTTIDAQRLDGKRLMTMDLSLQKKADQPQILIYHTHSQEAFVDSAPGDEAATIVGVGDYLTQILTEEYGYQVLHERGVFDLVDGVLDRNRAYDLAEQRVSALLEQYPSIEVAIDLHRDGVDGTKFVTQYQGRPAAKLMFIVGMSRTADGQDISYLPNPYIEQNLAMALQLETAARAVQPELMRNIYLMAYRFNMHLLPRSILLEAGTQLNTVAEEKTAMEAFAGVLDQVLTGEAP